MKTRGGTEPLGKFTVYGFIITPPPHTHTPGGPTEPDQTPPSFFPSSPPFFSLFFFEFASARDTNLKKKKKKVPCVCACGVVDVLSNKQLRAITVTYDLVW